MADGRTWSITMDGAIGIWEHYGPRAQARKVVEEAYELAEAINEHRSGEVTVTDHIREELADVLVLAAQVEAAYGLDHDDVMQVAGQKVARQLGRMRGGGNVR